MKVICCLTCTHYFKNPVGKMACGYENHHEHRSRIDDFYDCESYDENINAVWAYSEFLEKAIKDKQEAK